MGLTRERRIETLLAAHPYLIHRRFAPARTRTQLVQGKGRLDLWLELSGKASIVEIKRGNLTIGTVEQLERYLKNWAQPIPLARDHFLVGKAPRKGPAFAAAIKASPFRIHPVLLGPDIPLELAFDAKAGRYVPFDSNRLELAAGVIRLMV